MVRSDGGKEFCNHTMNSFFRSNGIRHQVTVRYIPEQNGRVERLKRDLMDKARAMMFQCGAPVKLWAEAVATANRVRNVILHLGKTKTPFELFYGQKPDLSRLRVFGCTTHVHVPKEKRKKLDARSEQGMMVGYSRTSKAWKIAMQKGSQMNTMERDSVVFDEQKLGPLSMCQPPQAPADPADTIELDSAWGRK